MKKWTLSLLLAFSLLLSLIPIADAVSFDNSVYLKQASGSKQCTLVSNVMMLRRRAYLENDPKWSDITIESVGNVTWGSGGMSLSYTYNGKKVYSYGVKSELGLSLGDVQSKKQYFIENLISHPEGIVIYVHHNSSYLHAVLLTDYDASTDTFYCADPAPSISTGRIPLSQSLLPRYVKQSYPNTGLSDQDLVIGYVQQTWMIIDGSGSIAPSPVQQYLDQCSSEPCNLVLTVTVPGHMNVIPCSTQTNPNASEVEPLIVGNQYSAVAKWVNTVNHDWYEVTSKSGQRGFIYSGDVTVSSPTSTLRVTETGSGIPSGNLPYGRSFGLYGIIESNYTITYIEAHIYDANGNDAISAYRHDWNSTSYNINTQGINNHFLFRNLGNGTYRYIVSAKDTSMNEPKKLIDSWFSIGNQLSVQFLNMDGFLDGVQSEFLDNYGKADVYINGNLVAEGWNDYWESWPEGTTYEIKNIRANDGYHYDGVYSGSLSGTIGTERVNVVLQFSTLPKTYFDLNGNLDNNPEWGNIDGFGTVDIYLNGVLAASGVSDYCEALPVGTTYEIRNIQALDGHVYGGVYSGALSGTIGYERVDVRLTFNTVVNLNLDGCLDGNPNQPGIGGYGTADIYINGNLDASGVSDYYVQWPSGTTYEIKNIQPLAGHSYDGVYSGTLSGTVGTQQVNVVLTFNTVQYTVAYDVTGGTGAPDNQIKTHGINLTLSGTEPTRASSSAGSYTVTLNANGGSVSTTSLSAARTTGYTFKNWNTAANGSGTSYNAGATYTTDAAATLYAQWDSSTTTAAVTLPTPTRDGFIFHGWATSASAANGVTGSYTPTGNATLYATWTEDAPTVLSAFSIDSVNAAPGGEIAVPIRLENNPGLIAVEVDVSYDSSIMEWIGVEPGEYGDTLGDYDMTVGQSLAWFAADERTDISLNGVFATLRFRVNENADDGETIITLSMDEDNIFNAEMDNVLFTVKPGTVTIKSHIPGDVNGDGKVNNKDYMALRRYIKYKDNAVVEAALDINGDGKINNKDYMTLRRYIKYQDIEIQ